MNTLTDSHLILLITIAVRMNSLSQRLVFCSFDFIKECGILEFL